MENILLRIVQIKKNDNIVYEKEITTSKSEQKKHRVA